MARVRWETQQDAELNWRVLSTRSRAGTGNQGMGSLIEKVTLMVALKL